MIQLTKVGEKFLHNAPAKTQEEKLRHVINSRIKICRKCNYTYPRTYTYCINGHGNLDIIDTTMYRNELNEILKSRSSDVPSGST